MKKRVSLTLFISILLLVSCSEKKQFGDPNIDFKTVENDFPAWWNYHSENIVLSSNFIPLDEFSNFTSKELFFQSLISGNYIPIKIEKKDAITYYQIFKLSNNSDISIRSTIKNVSKVVYSHYLMEGKKFPKFSFKDLEGNEFNNDNTKSKIVILKCWFIKCQACVEEFPELNELVDKYKNREDIIFLSLAFDTEDELNKFLINTIFNYKVASVERGFFDNELKINTFPTHFIIDKEGIIKKVVNTSDELSLELIDTGILNLKDSTLPIPPPPTPSTSL